MNLKEIKELIKLMNENDLGEVEVEQEGSKLKLKKNSANFSGVAIQPTYMPSAAAAPRANEAEPVKAAEASKDHLKKITSPMVGTFYRASSPDAAPYAEVGQVIEPGQVVCLVEAMKLMNEIKSEIRGKVVEIPAENAHPVEFGQVLFYIEPV